MGSEFRKVDRDLDPLAPTLFELSDSNVAALSVIGRGLEPRDREGHTLAFALRAARVHFSGDVRGWLAIDRDIGARVAARIRAERPQVAFCALTGIDKTSHAEGHDAAVVRDALRTVDETAARVRDDAERDGRWDAMHLWIVSDHGHSPVRAHEDLAGLIHSWKLGVIAHPWIYGTGRDVAVMVSGNAMAHLYLDLGSGSRARGRLVVARREVGHGCRTGCSSASPWTCCSSRWRETACEVRAKGRGTAHVVMKRRPLFVPPAHGRPAGHRCARVAFSRRSARGDRGVGLSRRDRADRASRRQRTVRRDHALGVAELGLPREVGAHSARVVARGAAPGAHAGAAAAQPPGAGHSAANR